MMKKCKLTILKTMLVEDLAKEYGVPGFSACPLMKEGDVFYAGYEMPEGFCEEAWKSVYQYVFALLNGANGFSGSYYDEWMNEEHKDVAICSCSDDLRPVIIKVERINEVS